MILLGYILVNAVVGETSQRKPSAREEHLDLIRGRELLNAVENIASLTLG
jgi:hypothetical protein